MGWLEDRVNRAQQEQQDLIKSSLGDISKAKYLRREGTKGNYKYVYKEPQSKGAGVKDNEEEVEGVAGNVIADIKSGLERGSKEAMARFGKLSAEGKINSNQLQHLMSSLKKYELIRSAKSLEVKRQMNE